jgi:hypothetical protein
LVRFQYSIFPKTDFIFTEIGQEDQVDDWTNTTLTGHDDIEVESSDEDKTLHDVKTSLLNNGYNLNDRETRL